MGPLYYSDVKPIIGRPDGVILGKKFMFAIDFFWFLDSFISVIITMSVESIKKSRLDMSS